MFHLFILASILLLQGAQGFTTGALTCRGQLPAVLDEDLTPTRTIESGFFSDVGLSLTIAGMDMDPTSTTLMEFPVGQDLDVTVNAAEFPIRGILVRIVRTDEQDASGALVPGDSLQNARVCQAPVTGVTNTDFGAKTSVSSTIRFNEPTLVLMEITIVFIDSPEAYVFVYDSFALGFSETVAPVAPSIAPPVAPPVAFPVAAPTGGGGSEVGDGGEKGEKGEDGEKGEKGDGGEKEEKDEKKEQKEKGEKKEKEEKSEKKEGNIHGFYDCCHLRFWPVPNHFQKRRKRKKSPVRAREERERKKINLKSKKKVKRRKVCFSDDCMLP